ncbi:hypothetical protein, partial [Marinimicrobium sp. UBA4209]
MTTRSTGTTKGLRLILLSLLFPLIVQAAEIRPLPPEGAETLQSTAFPLVVDDHAAPLVVASDAPEVIRIAVQDFADDVERVTGHRPAIRHRPPGGGAPYVRVGIHPALENRWEA